MFKVAIVGASGAVGQEIISLLEKRNIRVSSLRLFGSSRSKGISIPFQGERVAIEELSSDSFDGCDVVFFSAGSQVSREFAPRAVRKNALVIDNSSAFRSDPQVPLIIPEINSHAMNNHNLLIANPNCAVILLLMVLYPLHKKAKLKRIVVSTYQAASGAGLQAMKELTEETSAFLNQTPYNRKIVPHPYAFNLFLHNSPMGPNRYLQEEQKIIDESRKILEEPSLRIAATCVRVPVLRAHAESVNAEFYNPISEEEAYALLEKTPGVQMDDSGEQNRFAMPISSAGKEPVFYSRIRKDLSQENTLDLWIVGDQLLKGAALNAVQIFETLTNKKDR